MIKRPYNMRDAILRPATHTERLVVAERIVREVLAEHGTPGRVLDERLVKRVTEVTLAAVEMSIERAKS
jgi:hypothetical protein